jgi:hypothetical protein
MSLGPVVLYKICFGVLYLGKKRQADKFLAVTNFGNVLTVQIYRLFEKQEVLERTNPSTSFYLSLKLNNS